MNYLCAAVALLAVGCQESSRETPAPADKSSAAAASSGRTVAAKSGHSIHSAKASFKVEGQPIAVQSVLALSRGGKALQLTFSTHGLECDNLKGGGIQRERGEIAFDLTLAPRLAADGSEAWMVTRARHGTTIRQGELGKIALAASDASQTVKVGLQTQIAFLPPLTVAIDGAVEATGCGFVPWSDSAKDRPQKELEVELATHKLAMRGASLSQSAQGPILLLTSEAHACGHKAQHADFGIVVALTPKSKAVKSIRVSGYRLPRTLILNEAASAFSMKQEAAKKGGETRIMLDGKATIGGYDLRLKGIVRPELCP